MLNGAELRPGSKLANFKAKVMYLRTCPLEKINVPRISETVLCSLYFCSVSFDGCSPGGRRGMTNSKITRLKHRNLGLTHLICNAPSREKENDFHLVPTMNSNLVIWRIHRLLPRKLRCPSSFVIFCSCLCKTASSARKPFTETLALRFSLDFAFY